MRTRNKLTTYIFVSIEAFVIKKKNTVTVLNIHG